MADFDFECAVVGAGPAGLVSALYLGRFQRKTVIFASGTPRAAWIPQTRNLIGYDHGISGLQLLERLQHQVRDVGVTRIEAEVRVHRLKQGFRLRGPGVDVRAKKVILATGVCDVEPDIPRLFEFKKKGLLRYCPICDAYEYRGQPIALLARDDHGLRSALFLSAFASRIDVILAPDQRVPSQLTRKCREARVNFRRGRVERIVKCRRESAIWIYVEGEEPLKCRVCYVELGMRVNDHAFRHLRMLPRDALGRLLTADHQRLPLRGLFAVGDCTASLAQISVAAGGAAIAATAIHNELRDE